MTDLHISSVSRAEALGGQGTAGDYLALLKPRVMSLVIFTADHGEALGEEGRLGHGFWLNEELTRIPLLVRYPGDRDGGTGESDGGEPGAAAHGVAVDRADDVGDVEPGIVELPELSFRGGDRSQQAPQPVDA